MAQITVEAGVTFIDSVPLDLKATLDGGQAFRWYPEADGYRGVISDRVVHISRTGDRLQITAPDGLRKDGLTGLASDYLGLDEAFDAFYGHYADDELLGPTITGWSGLRILRQDPWECLVAFIASATSNIPRIKLNVSSIARALGQRIGNGEHDYAFPSPAAVAVAGENRLRELGLGFRAPYIVNAAQEVTDGAISLDRLRESPFDEARAELMSLEGVGEKIADCVLAFSLAKREAFPVDRWVRRALEEWCGMPHSLNNSKAADWARARFGDDGAYAQQYLFHRQRLSARSQDPAPNA